ncbi:hypothetical protein G5I_01218 [Acromyrmex echinatior]|uniref:Uncharacterized protein n=1 Tax=Acromyrmex echinatior TaxID=103372 RepID=F4W710_ACREC|nr:hypothetical protein G5I_01218 [Acromyrmex echinatior]
MPTQMEGMRTQAETKCLCSDCFETHLETGHVGRRFVSDFLAPFYCQNNGLPILERQSGKQVKQVPQWLVLVSGNKFKFRYYRYAKLILTDSLTTISDESEVSWYLCSDLRQRQELS